MSETALQLKNGRVLVAAAVSQELSFFEPPADGQVRCLKTGIGPRRSYLAVRDSLRSGDFAQVISAGFAGGTQAGLRTGELVVPTEVIDGASGAVFKPTAEISAVGQFRRGPLVTLERALASPEEKERAGGKFRALAADMESSAVAKAAVESNVPWTALRVILDPMEVSLRIGSWEEALKALASPLRWGEFLGFLKSVESAGRSLSRGLSLYLGMIQPS
ncbi:MAG: hypothetical protein HYZ90_05335 [Candidatus Omnitrophica bacterium]|nr:hypothetical protein [Candidatus Omnitrophota bacterium]